MRRASALLLPLLFTLAPALHSQPLGGSCTIGPGFGSTLLFPYFEADLGDPVNGVDTLLSIVNGYDDATMVRAVLWTDWGWPTLAFDIFLDGFATQTLSLRNVFNGNLPETGGDANLGSWPFCDTLPPSEFPGFGPDELSQLRTDHQGLAGPIYSDCSGEPHGDGIVRGYLTVDVVDECSGFETFSPQYTPNAVTYPYFSDGGGSDGIAIIDNRLWGDIATIGLEDASARGSEAVAIWADAELFQGTGIQTFYGHLSGWDGRDDRVPLPALWNQRFFNGGAFSGGASLTVLRDPGAPPETADCSAWPSYLPLESDLVATNEAADPAYAVDDPFAVGLVTQRIDVAGLDIPFAFGWLQLSTGTLGAWAQPTLKAEGLYSASWNGIPVAYLCDTPPPAASPLTPATAVRRSARELRPGVVLPPPIRKR